MKIFVSGGTEGTAGVVGREQRAGDGPLAAAGRYLGPRAAAGRQLLPAEVSVAIEGALAGAAPRSRTATVARAGERLAPARSEGS